MINWSLPNKAKLRGSHLIGLSLPNLVNTIMNKTSDMNLFYDLSACNKYFLDEEAIKKINTSCVIIAGRLDIMTPLKSGNKLQKLLKNSHIEILDDCGHFHIYEKSGDVRKLINKYIEN